MEKTPAPPNDDQYCTGKKIAGAAPPTGETANPQPCNKNCYSKAEQKHPLEYFIFGFVVLTAIGTLGAACYTRNQWITAADSEKRSLRAYVFVESAAALSFKDKTISATLNMKNSGQTPAYDFSEWAQSKIQKRGEIFIVDPKTSDEPTRAIIGPGGSLNHMAGIKLSDVDTVTIPAIQNETSILYIWGEGEYRDAFNNYWCIKFRFRGQKLGDDFRLGATSEGNTEDSGHCDNKN